MYSPVPSRQKPSRRAPSVPSSHFTDTPAPPPPPPQPGPNNRQMKEYKIYFIHHHIITVHINGHNPMLRCKSSTGLFSPRIHRQDSLALRSEVSNREAQLCSLTPLSVSRFTRSLSLAHLSEDPILHGTATLITPQRGPLPHGVLYVGRQRVSHRPHAKQEHFPAPKSSQVTSAESQYHGTCLSVQFHSILSMPRFQRVCHFRTA